MRKLIPVLALLCFWSFGASATTLFDDKFGTWPEPNWSMQTANADAWLPAWGPWR